MEFITYVFSKHYLVCFSVEYISAIYKCLDIFIAYLLTIQLIPQLIIQVVLL